MNIDTFIELFFSSIDKTVNTKESFLVRLRSVLVQKVTNFLNNEVIKPKNYSELQSCYAYTFKLKGTKKLISIPSLG